MKGLLVKVFATAVLAGSLAGISLAQQTPRPRPHQNPQVPAIPMPQQPVYQPQPVYPQPVYQPQPVYPQPVYQPQPVYSPGYQPQFSATCVAGQLYGFLPQAFPIGSPCTLTDAFGNVYAGTVQ